MDTLLRTVAWILGVLGFILVAFNLWLLSLLNAMNSAGGGDNLSTEGKLTWYKAIVWTIVGAGMIWIGYQIKEHLVS